MACTHGAANAAGFIEALCAETASLTLRGFGFAMAVKLKNHKRISPMELHEVSRLGARTAPKPGERKMPK